MALFRAGLLANTFSTFKHILRALLVLFLAGCVAEIGLRIHKGSGESTVQNGRGPGCGDAQVEGLLVPSWETHHRLKPRQTVEGRSPGGQEIVEIRTNSLGIRGPEPQIPKPPGVFRIVCLGSENVFAAEVPQQDTFCVRLQESLTGRGHKRVEVINAGIPGFCPLLSCLQVKHSLLSLQADLFVLNFDMADIARDYAYRRHTYVDDAGAPLACPHPSLVACAASGGAGLSSQFLVLDWCQKGLGQFLEQRVDADERHEVSTRNAYAWLEDTPPDWSVHIRQALSPLGQLQDLAAAHSTALAIAVCPAPWQVTATAGSAESRRRAGVSTNAVYSNRVPFEVIMAYAASRRIPCHNACDGFRRAERPERLFFHAVPALTAEGHELYARLLADWMTAQSLASSASRAAIY